MGEGIVPFTIGDNEKKIISKIIQKENSTLYSFVVSTFYLLLSKVSGQSDIIIGAVTNGRPLQAFNDTMGMFVNNVPFRINAHGEKTFVQLLNEIMDKAPSIFEKQHFDIEQLATKLNIEKKMGFGGSATCLMNFGDDGSCYGELLGEENRGMKNMFVLMNEARISVGLQGLSAASRAYLNALKYSRERIQGADLANFRNPEAPRVPIINHPDVRRMLLWMKSHTEALRAIIYFTAWCEDKIRTSQDTDEQEKCHGLVELLTPIIKSHGSDIGFQVADQAIMVHGGYGYITEYPVEQILRDVKVAAIFEGTNGIQALDLVGRKLGQKRGAHFADLVDHMKKTLRNVSESQNGIMELLEQAQSSVNTLEEMGEFFSRCSREGKFLVPISSASPFLTMAATIISAWMLAWQAALAQEKLDTLSKEKGVTPDDWVNWARFINDTPDAAFYSGKVATAVYFIRNILPQADAIARAIRTEDLSLIEIADSSFGPE
jgi:hypothetical protein